MQYGVGLGLLGSHGQPQRHYPDLMLDTRGGHRVAVELELTAKSARRMARIMTGYASDASVDAVLYLVPTRAIAQVVVRRRPPRRDLRSRPRATNRARRDRRCLRVQRAIHATQHIARRRPRRCRAMIEDPPPPRSLRPRSLLWPAIAFVALMTMPAWVAARVVAAAVLTVRFALRDIRHVRARDAEIAERAAGALQIGSDGHGRAVLGP